jgi:hypothetical protein
MRLNITRLCFIKRMMQIYRLQSSVLELELYCCHLQCIKAPHDLENKFFPTHTIFNFFQRRKVSVFLKA